MIRPAPTAIRIAGGLILFVALVSVSFAAVLVVRLIAGATATGVSDVLAQALFFVTLGVGIGFVGGSLLLGRRWARTPSFMVALIVALLGWYMTGPSGQPLVGIPVIVLGVVAVVLLFLRASQFWANSDDS